MIRLKRLSQPPALSWVVWDSSMPEAVVRCQVSPAQYQKAAAGGHEAVRQLVLGALTMAVGDLIDFTEQLQEL